MNGCAYDQKRTAYSATPRSPDGEPSSTAWECDKQARGKRKHRDLGPSGLDVLGLSLINAALVLILSRFNEDGASNLAEKFPVCNPSTKSWLAPLPRDSRLPGTLRGLATSAVSCEVLIMDVVLLESLFWGNLLFIFGRTEQKEFFSSVVGYTAIIGTLCSGMVVHDPASLFLVATPLWAGLAAVACFVASRASTRAQNDKDRRIGHVDLGRWGR
ncbi:unnamed protein product [Discula destructiva]